MAIKVRSTNEDIDCVKFLVHGRAGVGKTVLASTAPRPIILSAESGLLSLADQDVPYIQISSVADIEEAFEFLTESNEGKAYDTICLDSITEIGEVTLSENKKACNDPRQAYGQLNDEMASLIRGFRDIEHRHVYFSAKQARITDEHSGITTYTGMMPGKTLLQGLSYYFDEVFCLRIGEDDDGDEFRYLQTSPDISYEAKDRSGKLDKMERPDLGFIINKILGENK